MEGNLRFKIDWAGLYWQGNLPFLLCFTLYPRVFCVAILGGLKMEGLVLGVLRYLGKFMTKSIKLNLYSEFNLTIIDPCKILREIENKPVQFLSCFTSRM